MAKHAQINPFNDSLCLYITVAKFHSNRSATPNIGISSSLLSGILLLFLLAWLIINSDNDKNRPNRQFICMANQICCSFVIAVHGNIFPMLSTNPYTHDGLCDANVLRELMWLA